MKVSTEPVRRVSYSILEKGRMVIEAYSTEKNIKPTARKYNVQSVQIRLWKRNGFDNLYQNYLEEEEALKRQRQEHQQGTAAERAVALVETDEESNDADSIERQQRIQEFRKRRKRQSKAHRIGGGGRKCKLRPETIESLKSFFDEYRAKNFTINIRLMLAQVRRLEPTVLQTCSSEYALRHRIYRLLAKWNITWRKGTHQAQNTRHTSKLMRDFHRYVRNKIDLLGVEPHQIYNFDETDVQFTPHLNNTYHVRGSRTVKQKVVKCSNRCTVFLGASMAGEKVAPLVIYLGKFTKDGRIRRQLRSKQGFPQSMEYHVQENAWMSELIMMHWIEKVWKPVAERHERTLLLIDTFSAHITPKVSRALELLNTEVEWIPSGYTGKLQPLDVGINKPF